MIILTSVFDKIVEKVEQGLNSIFDFPVVLYQFIALIILFIVVKVFFWKKITKFLDDLRYKEIKDKNETKKLNTEAKLKLDKVNKQYDEMKKETEKLRKALIKEAIDAKEKIILEAKKTAKKRLDDLDLELKQEIINQEEKIANAIREIAYEAAKKILKRELRSSEYDNLINEITKEISNRV